MALVVGVSGGGGGGVRLTLSRWVQQFLGLRSRRQSRGRGSPSKSRTPGEEDDTLPLIKRPTSAYSCTPSLLATVIHGVQVDRTSGASITANGALVPVSSVSKQGPPEWRKCLRACFWRMFSSHCLYLCSFSQDMRRKNQRPICCSVYLTEMKGIVGFLTVWTIISGVGFVDYMFLKTLPDEFIFKIIFLVHFLVMLVVIVVLWAKFVECSQCCSSKEDFRHEAPV
ncbi:uncharacterized protein LOC112268862 [Brachypodium distachyon]|uniref:uncharacterized protein LOC112268862 n=1 Tax=Brachypodium distachyon TaxID=15368 RepID=UPI000D0D841A|nr:uncharacterized protein LOC112268862 [Brachypodium distachyon]|eukprot:XP_024310819.1 uncharacterized protein LOC112268862 [Brachypodium distachyon]